MMEVVSTFLAFLESIEDDDPEVVVLLPIVKFNIPSTQKDLISGETHYQRDFIMQQFEPKNQALSLL